MSLSSWRTKSYEQKCRLIAECLYLIHCGIPDDQVAELCYEVSGHFAQCAVIPDFLGGAEEWEPLADKVIDWLEKSLNEAEKEKHDERSEQILSEG